MKTTIINGITWGHSRDFTPLLACAQRYNELHPAIEIVRAKRTLQEFGNFSIELIIDRP